jgi:hypothetical protein
MWYLSGCVGQNGGNVLQGLGNVEAHVCHAIGCHRENGGQEETLSDICSASLENKGYKLRLIF